MSVSSNRQPVGSHVLCPRTMSTTSEHLSPAIIASIVEQCKQSTDKQPVVLLTTGSFNPVHRQHVEMHKTAKRALQQRYPISVVASVMSPSCDSYLRQKLDKAGRSASFLSHSMRCDLINQALEDERDIFVDKVARINVLPMPSCSQVVFSGKALARVSSTFLMFKSTCSSHLTTLAPSRAPLHLG